MAKRKRYTDEFRASAVLMLEAAGYPDKTGSLARVSRKTGVPSSTLSRWFKKKQNPPPSILVTHKKNQLTDWLRTEIEAALKEAPSARGDASYRDLVTGAAILIDKLQLLTGEPTESNKTEIRIRYADTDANPT